MVRQKRLSLVALALVALSGLFLAACASPAPSTPAPPPSATPNSAALLSTASPEPSATLPTQTSTPEPSATLPTPLPSSTPENTAMPPAAASTETTGTAASGSPTPVIPETYVAFDADFFADECPLFVGDNQTRTYGCDVGEYTMLHKEATTRFSYVNGEYDDAVIEANGYYIKGTGKYEYGVVFRANTDGSLYYVFTVTQDGKYNVALYKDEKYSDLIPYTASPLVNIEKDNFFKVVMRGSRFDFYLNDVYIDTVTDSTIPTGVVGLFFYNGDPNVEIGFDQLTISTFTPVPTKTPGAEDTTMPTPASNPTVVPTEEPSVLAWNANFTTGCDLFEGDSEVRQYKCINGEYVMHHKQATTRYAYYDKVFDDATVSAQGHWVSGTGQYEYGIVLRANTDGTLYYSYTVTGDGKYVFALYKDGKYTNLIPYTPSSLVKTGTESNRFRVVMRGSQFSLYLNDQFIQQVSDASIASGDVGVFFYNEQPDAQVAFDELSVSTFTSSTPQATVIAPSPTPRVATRPAPTRAPTVAVKPGIYVTNVRMSPSPPKRRQPVTFLVTFVNTTGKPQSFQWLVEIWDQDPTAKKRTGQADALQREIPIGTSERATGDSWKVASNGPCIPYRARVVFQDEQSNIVPFKRTNNTDFWITFQVCP